MASFLATTSGNISFIFGRPIICKTIHILTNRATSLSVCSVLIDRLIVDWWFEYMNPGVTPCGLLLDVSVLDNTMSKSKKKDKNKIR